LEILPPIVGFEQPVVEGPEVGRLLITLAARYPKA
jgi:hypothetical protein